MMMKFNKQINYMSIIKHFSFWSVFMVVNWLLYESDETFFEYLINRIVFIMVYVSIFYIHYHFLKFLIQKKQVKFYLTVLYSFLSIIVYGLYFEFFMFFGSERVLKYDMKTTIMLDVYFILFMMFGSSLYYFIKDHVINKRKMMNLEIQFLKDQIKPHYFNNELSILLSLISKNEIESSKTYIKNLSEYLVYTLQDDMNEQVLLKDEIHGIFSYLDNLEQRITSNSQIDYSVDGQSNSLKIYPLIFMTFIENAVKYSQIETMDDARLQLDIEIIENEVKFHLFNTISKDIAPHQISLGIGLKNVKRRLELQYSQNYELKLRNENTSFSTTLIIKLS